MRHERARGWVGALALIAGTLLVVGLGGGVQDADAAPDPAKAIKLPYTDGGVILAPPPQRRQDAGTGGSTYVFVLQNAGVITPIPGRDGGPNTAGAFDDVRQVLIQNRSTNTAAIRVGPSTVRGRADIKNGIRLAPGDSVTLDVAAGAMPYVVAEDTDAGQVVDVIYYLGTRAAQ